MADFVSSLHRGLQVLRAFTPAQRKLRLLDITNITGFPKTTVIRLVKTLSSLNYILFDPDDRKYYLGPEVLSLGFTALSSMDIREIAGPYLKQLAKESDQTVNLGILDGTDIVYIERLEKRQIIQIDLHVGSRLSSYRSSVGLAILAFLGKEALKKVLTEILLMKDARKTVGPEGEVLMERLKEVRKKGYALNDEEFFPGLTAIGAPVFDAKGRVEGAINIPVLSQMVSSEELMEKYAPLLLGTAQKISEARGYLGHPFRNPWQGKPSSHFNKPPNQTINKR